MTEGKLDPAKRVVMIQCVGSRNDERPYCSRICCASAVKNALRLKETNPEMDVVINYTWDEVLLFCINPDGISRHRVVSRCAPTEDSGNETIAYKNTPGKPVVFVYDQCIMNVV